MYAESSLDNGCRTNTNLLYSRRAYFKSSTLPIFHLSQSQEIRNGYTSLYDMLPAGIPDKAEAITHSQLVLPDFAVILKATPWLESTAQPLVYCSNGNMGMRLRFLLHIWDTRCCLLYCISATKLSHALYCIDPSFDSSPGNDTFCSDVLLGRIASSGCSTCLVFLRPEDRSHESKCKCTSTTITMTANDIRLKYMYLGLGVLPIISWHFENIILNPIKRWSWKRNRQICNLIKSI